MANDPEPALHIFLVRHYKPKVARAGFYNYTGAAQFIRDYDAAGIEEIINKPAGLPFEEVKRVHCSALPRARQTALAIFGPDITLVEDKLFNECERKILSLPLLRFPLKAWLAGARILWFLGLNSRGIETYKQARHRARQCATLLAQYAAEENKTVLVAHGMLNIFIRRYLKKSGWREVRHDGSGFLAVTELVKPLSSGNNNSV
jgi:broad specificity phosphatase PhoE